MMKRVGGLLGFLVVALWVSTHQWVPFAVVAVIVVGVWTWRAMWRGRQVRSSVCPHCGHDSGVLASVAPVCSACGRNRLESDPKRALRT